MGKVQLIQQPGHEKLCTEEKLQTKKRKKLKIFKLQLEQSSFVACLLLPTCA
jgi:hypothetical protein